MRKKRFNHLSLTVKKDIVQEDPLDTHLRHILNLGHTFGHAVEYKYKIPHGHAIMIGMIYQFIVANHLLGTQFDIQHYINYMNQLYPYYIVKNMHQLFLQITKEGARNTADSLDNMQIDIDMLVESVYRDRIERSTFHKQFLQFGIMLYIMVMLIQYLVGTETYIKLLDRWYILVLLHSILIINSCFLLKGEKYYNENVGAE